MAKFYGAIGFGSTDEVPSGSGIWKEVITSRFYRGDVFRISRQLEESEHVNHNVTISNRISIVADAFANQNLFRIRCVSWMGANWTVTNVEVQSPRLVLTIGGVYNGN